MCALFNVTISKHANKKSNEGLLYTIASRKVIINFLHFWPALYVPPALIFPRKRLKPELLNGAPAESIMFVSDSGYINSDLFCRWLNHFQKHVRPTAENPVLLVLDNHASYCTLETVTFCKTNNIHLLSIPPHAGHKVKPLDRAFFKSLKDFYSDLCDQWLVNNP